MTPEEFLTGAWLCLTGWESGNEIWIRADMVRAVLEGTPTPAEAAPVFTFPGHPVPPAVPGGRPYTLVEGPTGVYKVTDPVDSVLSRLADILK